MADKTYKIKQRHYLSTMDKPVTIVEEMKDNGVLVREEGTFGQTFLVHREDLEEVK